MDIISQLRPVGILYLCSNFASTHYKYIEKTYDAVRKILKYVHYVSRLYDIPKHVQELPNDDPVLQLRHVNTK